MKITEAGKKVLFGHEQAQLVVIKREAYEAKNKQKKKRAAPQAPALPMVFENENDQLFEALRVLRKKLADQQAIPAYIVLSDKVLHLLASSKPVTIEAFGEISGIGEYKKERYGKDFIKVIRQFVSQSE